MMGLPTAVGFETLACLFEQRRDHREVALRTRDPRVSEIGRQMRQMPLHVGAFAVPRQQAMDGKGVAVMPRAA
jgi:hypothetical protein